MVLPTAVFGLTLGTHCYNVDARLLKLVTSNNSSVRRISPSQHELNESPLLTFSVMMSAFCGAPDHHLLWIILFCFVIGR